MLFFLLPWVTLILLVVFGLLMAWRMWRQQGSPARPAGIRRRRRRRRGSKTLPLVPAALLRGADRTWVVFARPGCDEARQVEERLRTAEPDSQVTVVDASREPRLAEAFGVRRIPTTVLANRYGQVEARLVGLRAIEEFTEARA
ncbi:MAG TPA: thioredoxin family protein [Acidimicrobiales bacterium]